MNAAACRILIEAGIKNVVILWDAVGNKMAVRGAHEGEKNSYTVTFAANATSGTFAVKSFLQHIGWHAAEKEALPTVWNASEKMFEVTLPAKFVGTAAKAQKKAKFI